MLDGVDEEVDNLSLIPNFGFLKNKVISVKNHLLNI